jgi:hypothetical protein
MRNTRLHQLVWTFGHAFAGGRNVEFFDECAAFVDGDELRGRVPECDDDAMRVLHSIHIQLARCMRCQIATPSQMQDGGLCIAYIELDFDPTKRVQNFGGGSGPAGGGRQALASKSINLWQAESDLVGGM